MNVSPPLSPSSNTTRRILPKRKVVTSFLETGQTYANVHTGDAIAVGSDEEKSKKKKKKTTQSKTNCVIKRMKLPEFTTWNQCIDRILQAKRIVVLVGAGISVSCGIPDFRSKNGVYAMINTLKLDIPTSSSLFQIDYFKHNPIPFYKFAKKLFPGA